MNERKKERNKEKAIPNTKKIFRYVFRTEDESS